jgi:hypothetical protein
VPEGDEQALGRRGLYAGLFAADVVPDEIGHRPGHDIPGVGRRRETVGSLIFRAVLVALTATMAVRAWFSSTVKADGDGFFARSYLRTRRWRWDQVREFVTDTRSSGVVGYRRRTLGILLSDGTTNWRTDITCPGARDGGPTWIDDAVAKLNARRQAAQLAKSSQTQ